MKPQDIIFLVIFIFLIYKRNPKLAVILGLFSIALSIPLFASWTFFTAERLTWYAAAFFLLSIFLTLRKKIS
jgi:hypothetical protein